MPASICLPTSKPSKRKCKKALNRNLYPHLFVNFLFYFSIRKISVNFNMQVHTTGILVYKQSFNDLTFLSHLQFQTYSTDIYKNIYIHSAHRYILQIYIKIYVHWMAILLFIFLFKARYNDYLSLMQLLSSLWIYSKSNWLEMWKKSIGRKMIIFT